MDELDLEHVGADARAWFVENWDPNLAVGAWWERLADSGWGLPHWPSEWYGRGLPLRAVEAVNRARTEVGAFGPPGGISTTLVGPTLFDHGGDEQRQRFLPSIVSGATLWCQLFSEPGAGSDLAGVRTTAVRDGDEWVVNGQKVWTTGGHTAQWAVLVARTDPDVPKHRGLTFFAIPVDQAGIEIRPLRDMTGDAEFNEVFLTDARTAHDNVIGDVGRGWGVAMTMLSYERNLDAVGADGGGDVINTIDLAAPVGQVQREQEHGELTGFSYTTGTLKDDVVWDLVARFGDTSDPVLRQELMHVHSLRSTLEWTAARDGEPSLVKLMNSELCRRLRDLGFRVSGLGSTLVDKDAPDGGHFQKMALFTQGMSIAGGTDEVQKNILGERVLGLPAEPRVDKDVPFRELRT